MKKIFFCAAVVAAAVFGVMKATEVNNTMTDLQMENVEALANDGDDRACACKIKIGHYCTCGTYYVLLDHKDKYY